MKFKDLGEFGVIDLFRSGWPEEPPEVVRGIGDDCAVLDVGGPDLLLITTDMLIQNVHFRLETISPYQLGVRSMAANLSDVAAMGGLPTFSFISFGAPGETDDVFLESFLNGYRECSLRHGAYLLGGDTVSSDRLVVNIALLGKVERNGVLLRNGARPGDKVYVTGFLGDSAAGLDLLSAPETDLSFEEQGSLRDRHLTPEPRIAVGRLLARSGRVHSCQDISDGLASDLGHICRESRVGARVYAPQIPISDACRVRAGERGIDPLEWALFGGEDFELVFTVPESPPAPELASLRDGDKVPITEIGEITTEPGVRLIKAGAEEEIAGRGYVHFRNA